ncbi:cobalt-zinc-cadmium efflux system protein|uniref:Zinc transporter ZitB n=1 Tax=Brenneria salicis ATCC 15712 = DSM 30166 TaxID=714314 RepID=A0A366IB97_9GAMM|nr:CDF family zinc transporter ZitB [Brenneria salicis]NMN92185.1 cobalt-zinc-cadmium efflux system protein [Brenneria salicis ATCC 15712 = DSM 30166]RBP67520.1 cobalt-zinc-cadmium efflux system protein [Brenneria salicis ATCC 15712 = DSM 30166]RLM32493.1 zinc transporter ZitB [Brenneria salicis ATCC 15712 = DSM 30166]
MAHDHNHTDASNSKRLLAAFIITTTFMVAEVVGGLLSGSLALLADAGHMLTDAAALFVALMAVSFARKKPNARHTFGYLRFTTLAAFVNALTLLVITAFIVWEAIRRFYEPQPVAGVPMLAVAIGGLLANIVAFWLLHRGSEEKNINVRAAALHVLGDLLGSVGAIIAALIILFTNWTPIDPILSILVSCLVLRSAWSLMKESIHELLEGTPSKISIETLKKDLTMNIPEVRNIHHVHIWQIGEKPMMTLHAQVIPPYDHDALLKQIQAYLLKNYQIDHTTIQMEYQNCDDDHCDFTAAEGHQPH